MVNAPFPRPVTLIGVPTDVGAARLGAAMGPDALRVAQLGPALERLGLEVEDLGNLHGPPNPRGERTAEACATSPNARHGTAPRTMRCLASCRPGACR